MIIEVGKTYKKKNTGKKMNIITNARSQYYGRAIEFEVVDIDKDVVTYKTIHPTRGEVERESSLKRFLKLVEPTFEIHYKDHILYLDLLDSEKEFLNKNMNFVKENLRSRQQDEDFLKEVTQFAHVDQLKQLYLNSDEEGNIMATNATAAKKPAAKKATPKVKVAKEKKEKAMKTSYSKGAIRRWKKSGALSEDGSVLTLDGKKYDVTKSGKQYLVTPYDK